MATKLTRVRVPKKLFNEVRKANPDIADLKDAPLARVALNRMIPQEAKN